MNERRQEPRLLCSDLIKVRVDGAEPLEVVANLEDISPSGACVQFEERVPAGAAICLTLGRHKLHGRVMYCEQNEIGYFAGVRFEAGQKWSRKLYKPKHLLDPAKIVARQSKTGA